MKKFSVMKKWLFVVIFAIFSVAVLSACADDKTVEGISVFENSVPTVYEVDGTFPNDAKITVKYKSGKTETVAIVFAEHVSGFDTSLSGKRTMTVSYGGKSVDVEYNVNGNVNTKIRLTAEITADNERNLLKIALKLSGLDTLSQQLYAIRIVTAYEPDKFRFVSAETSRENLSIEKSETQGSVSVIVYGKNTESAISSDGVIAELGFSKETVSETFGFKFSGGYAGYDEIDASDGEQMLFLPSFGLESIVIED